MAHLANSLERQQQRQQQQQQRLEQPREDHPLPSLNSTSTSGLAVANAIDHSDSHLDMQEAEEYDPEDRDTIGEGRYKGVPTMHLGRALMVLALAVAVVILTLLLVFLLTSNVVDYDGDALQKQIPSDEVPVAASSLEDYIRSILPADTVEVLLMDKYTGGRVAVILVTTVLGLSVAPSRSPSRRLS